MCQVGDRLIPVGVGRIQTPEEAAAEATDVPESRRSRRRQQQQNGNFEQFVGTVNQDLEELMLMEAMHLSLIDREEHQRKEAEENKKRAEVSLASGAIPASDTPSEIQATPGPGPSTIEAWLAPHSSISSNLSSPPASVAPISSGSSANSKNESQDGLAPSGKSWSISSSRTPELVVVVHLEHCSPLVGAPCFRFGLPPPDLEHYFFFECKPRPEPEPGVALGWLGLRARA
ncbi:hypothetical protein K443DRAFT_436410 [Laccaria amethystina LaAM-08-1]|uniref:Uncharacterized protein n=1 Tax=Laccaria amethystina LaAM-08-1 TaxID=1095629 RepID=A0A0C9WUZ1_9AGAR|nr:hypothetical protein K443DRAFT_436410 [Laccaria amethystina LaAM-08-1]